MIASMAKSLGFRSYLLIGNVRPDLAMFGPILAKNGPVAYLSGRGNISGRRQRNGPKSRKVRNSQFPSLGNILKIRPKNCIDQGQDPFNR